MGQLGGGQLWGGVMVFEGSAVCRAGWFAGEHFSPPPKIGGRRNLRDTYTPIVTQPSQLSLSLSIVICGAGGELATFKGIKYGTVCLTGYASVFIWQPKMCEITNGPPAQNSSYLWQLNSESARYVGNWSETASISTSSKCMTLYKKVWGEKIKNFKQKSLLFGNQTFYSNGDQFFFVTKKWNEASGHAERTKFVCAFEMYFAFHPPNYLAGWPWGSETGCILPLEIFLAKTICGVRREGKLTHGLYELGY